MRSLRKFRFNEEEMLAYPSSRMLPRKLRPMALHSSQKFPDDLSRFFFPLSAGKMGEALRIDTNVIRKAEYQQEFW